MKNDGKSWRTNEVQLQDKEIVYRVALSNSGEQILIVGSKGSILVARKEKRLWKRGDSLNLKGVDWIDQETITKNGKHILISSVKGSVEVLSVERNTPYSENLNLGAGEKSDRPFLLSRFKNRNVGKLLENPFLTSAMGEMIIASAFKNDGQQGLLISNKGRLFLTTNGGKSWDKNDLGLTNGELVIQKKISSNGKHILLVGNKGTVLNMSDDGKFRSKINLGPEEEYLIADVALSNDGKRSLIVGRRGPVFTVSIKQDGKNYSKSTALKLKPREWITHVALSNDGKHGLIAGNKGSAFVTTRWRRKMERNRMGQQCQAFDSPGECTARQRHLCGGGCEQK